MINRDAALKLEDYVFSKIRERRAADFMAGVVGVLINIKPSMSEFFTEKEFAEFDPQEFLSLMDKLGLKCVVSHHSSYCAGHFRPSIDLSIAKDFKKAVKIKKEFETLWKTMDEFGQIVDTRGWKIATKRIGRLLGYPMTAVKDFLKEEDIDNPNRQERMERNRYYAHSAKHEKREFLSYDRPINLAVEKYTKKTAEVLKENSDKRWTRF